MKDQPNEERANRVNGENQTDEIPASQAKEVFERLIDAYSGGGDYGDEFPYPSPDDDNRDELSDYEQGYEDGSENSNVFYHKMWHVRWHMSLHTHWWILSHKIRWNWYGFRRWLTGKKSDNSDIPF